MSDLVHTSSQSGREVASTSGAPVLVSGASFAGLATAYWLDRLGYRVTVVEVANGLRKGGTPVDIEGETIDALANMGLLKAVLSKALPPRGFEFKNADDETIGGMSAPIAQGKRYEIHRDDLLEILFAAVEHSVDIVFDRTIERLENGPAGVRVTFNDGSRQHYTFVIGCDGNRSRVRRLAFGDAESPSHFMGGYFVIKVVPETGLLPANVSQIFSVPGRTALLNGYDDRTDIALAFRSVSKIEYDYRDRGQQRRMIHDHFAGLGWKIPGILKHLDEDDSFYFDSINQIRMPTWSNNRVVLVGDAGYCVSPVAGMGGSMAIIGAARLADALQHHGNDYASSFQDYHDRLRSFVIEVQEKAVRSGMAMMFPADDAELAERDRRLSAGQLDL